jgi:translocation and assembly module TamB
VEPVFNLEIDRVRIEGGVFQLNNHPVPFSVLADELTFSLTWLPQTARYDGQLRLGKWVSKYGSLGEVPASLSARFSMWRDHLRLDSAEIGVDGAQAELYGELSNFNNPAVTLEYQSSIDVARMGLLLHSGGLRGGRIEARGEAALLPPQQNKSGMAGGREISRVSARGQLSLHDLEYAGRDFRLPGISGEIEFAATQDQVLLPRIALSLFGGTAVGEGELSGRPAPVSPRSALRDTGNIVRLRLQGLRLPRAVAAFSSSELPLNRLRVAGDLGGKVEARWKRLSDPVVVFALQSTPPAKLAGGELPVVLHLEGSYARAAGEVTLTSLNLSAPATRVEAHGKLGGADGTMFFSATTRQPSEWASALSGSSSAPPWPLELRGSVALTGSLKGPLKAPRWTGHVELVDFATLGTASSWFEPRATSGEAGPQYRLDWSRFAGEIDYSDAGLHVYRAVLRRGPAEIDFHLGLPLERARLAKHAPFEAQVRIRQGEAAELLAIAGLEYPVRGKLDANLRFGGVLADPSVSGAVALQDAHIYGQAVDRARADVEFLHQQVRLSGIEWSQAGGKATGELDYNLQSQAYGFNLQGNHFELAKIPQLQTGRIPLSGRVQYSARGRGTLEAPVLEAELRGNNVVANGAQVGDLDLSATTEGETLRLTGHSASPYSDLEVLGSAHLRGNFPVDLEVRLKRANLEPLLRMVLPERSAGPSELAGSIRVTGPLRSPGDLAVAAEIDRFSAGIERVDIRNDGPIRLTFAHRLLRVEQLRLAGSGTSLAVAGSLNVDGNRALDVSASGQVNLKLLESLDPSLVAQGQLTLDMRLRGTLEHPLMNGRVEVAGASLSQVDLPNGLSELNGRLLFSEDRLQVESLTGKTGGGTIDIRGYATYGRTVGLNLTAKGHDIRLRYPPGVSSMADANLRLTGSTASALLAGDITVTRFGVNPQFDFATYLAQAKQPERVPDPRSLPARVRLDVHVVSPPELQIQTSLAKVSGDMDLRLRGSAARPVLLGRVNIVEGDIDFNATKYHLERGGVTFNNPVTTQPVLDIEATTRVRDYDITLGFHGPADKLSTTYRSDPPLATADIISLLAFGRTREETAADPAQTTSNLTPETQSILYQALNAAVSSRIQKLFGVSRIKIDPQAGGAENNPAGPRLTIEQQVASNLTLTYITDVARANYQTIQAEYNVNRNVSVVAIRDWNGVVSFDIRIRQRRR